MTRKKNETPLTDANLLASDIEQQEYPRRRRNKKRGFVGVFIGRCSPVKYFVIGNIF